MHDGAAATAAFRLALRLMTRDPLSAMISQAPGWASPRAALAWPRTSFRMAMQHARRGDRGLDRARVIAAQCYSFSDHAAVVTSGALAPRGRSRTLTDTLLETKAHGAAQTRREWAKTTADPRADPLAAETAPRTAWVRERTTLSFRVGVLGLHEAWLDTLVQTAHVSRLCPGDGSEPPLAELARLGGQVAYLPSCPIDGEVPAVEVSNGWIRYLAQRFPHYFTRVDQDFATYEHEHLSKSARKKLRKTVRRFKREVGGQLDYREYRGVAGIDAFVPLAKQVSAKTYQQKLLGRGFAPDSSLNWRVREDARADRARGYLLFAGDTPVAFNYCWLAEDDIMIVDVGGYDPAYAKWSPGTVLDFLMLEASFTDPTLSVVDFGEGQGDYKERFATDRLDTAKVYWFRPTPRHIAVFGGHLLISRAYHEARSLLEKLGWFEPLRRLARRQGRPSPPSS